MAWLVSVKLHPFLAAPQVFASQRERHSKMAAHCVFSSLKPKRVAVSIMLSTHTSEQTTAVNHRGGCHVMLSSSHMTQASKLSHVSYGSRTITGYWIGPDSDDGWGFAEALVDEIL